MTVRRSESAAAALEVLRALPMPVVVVGAGYGSERSCSTATLTYVSIEPALVAVPFSSFSRTLHLAQQSGEFSVAIVPAGGAELASMAGRRATTTDKFIELAIPLRDDGEAPALASEHGTLWCSVADAVPHGDHMLVVGRVHHAAAPVGTGSALVRSHMSYYEVGAEVPSHDAPPYPL